MAAKDLAATGNRMLCNGPESTVLPALASDERFDEEIRGRTDRAVFIFEKPEWARRCATLHGW